MGLVRNIEEFNGLSREIRNLVDIDLTIPKRVFKSLNWQCAFCSFDLCFSPSLLHSCASVCKTTRDERFSIVMIDPDPVNYYFKEFGRFGAVTLTPNDSIDLAWSIFEEDPGDSPADALMYAIRRFVVLGPSMRWAVWGSRDDEVIVCGGDSASIIRAFSKGDCCAVDVGVALITFLSGVTYADIMMENYCAGQGD